MAKKGGKKATKGVTKKGVMSMIKKYTWRTKELKRLTHHQTEVTLESTTGTPNCFKINGPMNQGTGYGQMDGHIIQGQYFTVRSIFTLAQTTPSNMRVGIRELILCLKIPSDYTNLTAGTAIFEGTAGNSNMEGTIKDLYHRINKDKYKVIHDKLRWVTIGSLEKNIWVSKIYKKCYYKYQYDGPGNDPVQNLLVHAVFCRDLNNDANSVNVEVSSESTFGFKEI